MYAETMLEPIPGQSGELSVKAPVAPAAEKPDLERMNPNGVAVIVAERLLIAETENDPVKARDLRREAVRAAGVLNSKKYPGIAAGTFQPYLQAARSDLYGSMNADELLTEASQRAGEHTLAGFDEADYILGLDAVQKFDQKFISTFRQAIVRDREKIAARGIDKLPILEKRGPSIFTEATFPSGITFPNVLLSELDRLGPAPENNMGIIRGEIKEALREFSSKSVKKAREAMATWRPILNREANEEERTYLAKLKAIVDSLKDGDEIQEALIGNDRRAAYEVNRNAFSQMDLVVPAPEIGGRFNIGDKTYSIQEKIGSGGFGDTFLVTTSDGEKTVVKYSKPNLDRRSRAIFAGEVYNLILLKDYQEKHGFLINGKPLTPEFLSAGSADDGRVFFMMTYAQGEIPGKLIHDYEESVKKAPEIKFPIEQIEALDIGVQVCKVLESMHGLGKGLHDFQLGEIFWDKNDRRITVTDLNLCTPFVTPSDVIEEFDPKRDLQFLGIRVLPRLWGVVVYMMF